ncbi:uncharacterized protein [Centruroides vittatus]|uniref:uncharacterized protein n=1 Tax=Centruroides vittatus TaxID=120091 RepID=UPI00350F5248
MTENGKSKLFNYFDACARPLRRHVGSTKEMSKFVCKEANEKENFMFRCCLAYRMRRDRDSSLPRVFETCLKRGAYSPIQQSKVSSLQKDYPSQPFEQQLSFLPQQQGFLPQITAQQQGFLPQTSTQQQSFLSQTSGQQNYQSPVVFDESAEVPYVY